MAYLNGNTRIIAVGGKQVNADWNETNPLSPAYIQNKPDISGALTRQIVDELPVTDIDPNCIYMVLKSDPDTGDYYDEFMYIDGSWEQIGSTQVAQVQSDWNESDPTSPAYIDNKPTIPTAVSELTNDEGFITINDVPAQVQSDWNESDSTSPAYIDNKPDTLDFIVPFTEVSDVISTTVAKADIIAAMNAGKTVRATLNGQFYELVAYHTSPEKMSFSAVLDDTTVSIVGKIVNNNWTWESYDTELNVQADWNESDANSPAYIQNKPTLATVATSGDYTDLSNTPTIPTVNDATITIQQNGTTVGTFTTNDADDTTINLTGGGGDAWYGTQAEYDMLGPDALIEGKDYYIEGDIKRVAVTGDFNDLSNRPTAPVAFSNKYQDLSQVPTPTQTTFLGRQDLDWYGTQAEFDALEQAGQLEFYRNYYIEGDGPTNLVTGYNGASYTIRKISQTDYDNLGTYDANTIYLIY